MLLTRDFQTGGGYPFVKNSDKAKGDASSKDDDNSKNDVNSKSANISNNGVVNSNIKDDSSANNSTDVKKSKAAVYKSAQSTKEVSKDKKANGDKAAIDSGDINKLQNKAKSNGMLKNNKTVEYKDCSSTAVDQDQTPNQKTELLINLMWGEMNDEYAAAGGGRLVKPDGDFGKLSHGWPFLIDILPDRKDIYDAFKKIKFEITDENTSETFTTEGVFSKNSKVAVKSLGYFNPTHTYQVSVVDNTIPSPYFVTYDCEKKDKNDRYPEWVDSYRYFKWYPSRKPNAKTHMKSIRMDVLEVIYANDESVADKCFSYTQPKDSKGNWVTEGDWKFTYNNKNIFSRLRIKDNALQFPTTDPTKVGYKFVRWQFDDVLTNIGRPYTSADRADGVSMNGLRMWKMPFDKSYSNYLYLLAQIRDNKGINVYEDKCGTQYGLVNHTFIVFPEWVPAGSTVTFINEGREYAKVKVQENKSIDNDEWTTESMPANPSKYGYSFMGWNTKADGTGSAFLASTTVNKDMTVYAIYTNYPPTLTLQDKTITEGDLLDLNSLIISATDLEDGDLTSKVKLTDNGGFDNTKVGSYKVTFSVTDNGGYSATASATVTVAKKPVPLTKLNIAPTLTLRDKTITEGDSLDLNSLIVSATDPEDGDLTSKVKLTDNGGFDNTKVGSYKITFSVTDNGGYSATASATVTVAKKPVPLTKLNIAPTLTLRDKTITEGDPLDLKTLVVSAQDPEDGDLTSKVKLTDNGGFDNTKVGSYKVTFSVTDSGKASITKSATVTVAKKPVQPKPEEPIPDIDWDDIPTPDTTPDTEPIPTLTPILTPVPVTPTPEQPEQPTTQPVSHTPAHAAKHLPQTGVSVASILAAAIASLFAGVASLGATTKRKRKTTYK